MAEVEARLKTSKAEWEAEKRAEGFKDGHKWASEEADYADLRAVAKIDHEVITIKSAMMRDIWLN